MSLLFIGDVCTNEYSEDLLKEFKGSLCFDFLSKNNGYVIGNLEAPFLPELIFKNDNKACFINNIDHSTYIDFVDIFNLSNNHIMDQGYVGLEKSIFNLKNNEKLFFGAGENINKAREPIIIEEDGYKFCLLSYCCYSTNSECYAKKSSPGPSPLVFEYIQEDVEKYRKEVDFIIVLPHWGVEHEFHPTYDQVILARKIIDLGVDAIIGTHSHTIQSFETYKGKSIYYSLGNFLMNNFHLSKNDKYYWTKFNKEGLIVELVVSDGKITCIEKYIKFNSDMLPELCSEKELKTEVVNNNDMLLNQTKLLNHDKYESNLNLALKFNGKSMQVVNDSKLINSVFSGKVETFKAKIKRLVMIKIRKFF